MPNHGNITRAGLIVEISFEYSRCSSLLLADVIQRNFGHEITSCAYIILLPLLQEQVNNEQSASCI